MLCPICRLDNTKEIYSEFPGYVEGTTFKIFECTYCNTQFIFTQNIDPKIYDIAYSNELTPGYDRYYRYAKEIKKHKDPLKFLSKEESTYYPIYRFMKRNKKKLKILEVGCGFGYLSYALHQIGHDVFGIDISKNAIHFAKSNFGKFFSLATIGSLGSVQKFDLIIATELIEHLMNPLKFIEICMSLLKSGGNIILTTPNKDYSSGKSIWKTDLPPVHTVWLSKKSFKNIAQQFNLNCTFVNFFNYIPYKENDLSNFFFSRINQSKLPAHILNKSGGLFNQGLIPSNSLFKKMIRKILLFPPIKYVSHLLVQIIHSENPTLGVILSVK